MSVEKILNLKTLSVIFAVAGSLSITDAYSRSTYACFYSEDNGDFVTFLKHIPVANKCDVVRELEGLKYASSKGPNVGFTLRLDKESGSYLRDRPDAYSLGGNRLLIFKPLPNSDKGRMDALSVDAWTMFSMPKFDSAKKTFFLPSSIRTKCGERNPYISIAYGDRDYKRSGKRTIVGSVDRDMCGDLIKVIDRPHCQVPGVSSACLALRNFGFHYSNRPNVSVVDASLMRPLRKFDVKYDKKYALSRENVRPQIVLRCSKLDVAIAQSLTMANLITEGYRRKRKTISKLIANDNDDIVEHFLKSPVNVYFSSYQFGRNKSRFAPKSTIVHIYEYEHCGTSRYNSIFQIIDIKEELAVSVAVSQAQRKNLIANPASYVNFLSQLLAAGFDENVAQAAIIRIATMKKI